MFESRSEPLYDFFNASGVAYYIPFYQRQYSWDRENIEKMMDDLYDGVRKICIKDDYLRFIGSIILWEEKNPEVGAHNDTNGLITKIFNVIDGQQRISTLAIVAILLSERLKEVKKKILGEGWNSLPYVDALLVSIENRLFELQEFYSNEVKKANVDPGRKPIIIRAFDAQSSPVADQWTLKGDYRQFYRSPVSSVIAHYIKTDTVMSSINNARLQENINEIRRWIDKTAESVDFPTPDTLIEQNSHNLRGFIDGEFDISALEEKNADCAALAAGTVKILALIYFLSKKTYLTVIECPTEDLAFDMFQSLNATGTPLTAIEVFKPLVVNTLGNNYGKSRTKEYFDLADKFFDTQKSAADKEKLTDELLLRMSLVHDGFELGKRFSEQRDWLTKAYLGCSSSKEKEEFIRWLADLTSYWENVFLPRKPRRDSTSFFLVNHLVKLGLAAKDADLASLCIYFIKDANHAMAHYLISLFYSKLLRSHGRGKKRASTEFLEVCKASAGFFTLWRSSLSGYPDEAYRDLFRQSRANISWLTGGANQSADFVKSHFRNILAEKKVYDLKNKNNAMKAWKEKAVVNLGYGKKTLARFALFVTSSDKAPDMSSGNEGLIVKGTPGSAQYLICEKWYSSDFEVIEHIANRDKQQSPYSYAPPDPGLYPGNYSVVDKIGNLTLWSRSANSSAYYEWPDKVYYYTTLTSLTPTQPADLAALKIDLKIIKIPPGLSGVSASSNYIVNLAPIALRGVKGLVWNKNIVDRRTDRICELLFDELYNWLT